MLVGAIIIVVKAPRCKKEPTPAWYQDTVVYQADVNKFAGNLAGRYLESASGSAMPFMLHCC